MHNDDWKIIARIQRDSNNEVIVKSGKYWKLDVVALRRFKNRKTTKKGLRVNMEEAVLLSKALNKIVDDIDDTE